LREIDAYTDIWLVVPEERDYLHTGRLQMKIAQIRLLRRTPAAPRPPHNDSPGHDANDMH